MSATFYTLLTDIGAAKLASAAALGVPLKITQMAVGDGGGVLPTPSAQQTKLIAEKRRADLNMLYIDPHNSSQIVAEQVIPVTEGGWWIREVGLFDDTDALIAVGNCPESYKPQLAEGSGRTQTVRMVLITRSTDNITLKIDPSVVLATRQHVDDKVLELKVYVDERMAKHIGLAEPHTQYAPKASPTFTGVPKAPTARVGNNTTQIATTAFIQAALTGLVSGAPGALDTLKAIAGAINNDPHFATTMTNALAKKQPLDATLTALAGLEGGANRLPYFTGADTVAQTDLTQIGRDILGKTTVAAVRQYLDLTETVDCAKNALDKRTGGTVKGDIMSQGTQISLKGDDRKHLGFHNQDGSVRMWLYKDKGGDGVRLNNGNDGGGVYVFHKDGGFRAPAFVYAGAAKMASDGNIYGSMWGNQWLNVYLKNTFQPKGAYGKANTANMEVNGWWKCGDTGVIIQWARYGKGKDTGTYNFPLPMKFPKAGLFCIGYVGTAINAWGDNQSQSAHLVDNATVRVTIDNGLESVVLAIGF